MEVKKNFDFFLFYYQIRQIKKKEYLLSIISFLN